MEGAKWESQRLIVIHAGRVEGWVPGTDLVFRSTTNSTDYHEEMNSEHFIEWFTQQLLPNIPPTSVIVLDNASYHNKQKDKPPTTVNRKDDIKRQLDEHNIEYDDKDIKKTLLERVKQHRPAHLYLTDEAAHTIEEFIIELEDNSDNADNNDTEEDTMDKDDRQLIDKATLRCNLTEDFKDFDQDFQTMYYHCHNL